VIRPSLASPPILLAAIFCLWGGSAVAEDAIGGDVIVTKDMKPWEGCGECHDLDGVAPNGHFPNLAAQRPAYFRKQMADFRDGRRSNDHGQMGTSSRGMSDQVLDQVVTYFFRLPPAPPYPLQRIDEENVGRAHRLIEEGDRTERIPPCANCHGAHPKHDYDAPCLEAQQAGYIAKELYDFKTGRRANDHESAMQKVAQKLSEPDIELLAAYLASLPRPTVSGVASCGEGL